MREHGISGSGNGTESSLPNSRGEADTIVEGILAEADQQAAQLLTEVEHELQQKLQRAEAQAAALLREAEANSREQAGQILNEARARAENEKRKAELLFRQQLESKCIEKALRLLAERTGKPGYADILCSWIVEAAVGLDAEAALVFSSEGELAQLDDRLLRKAEHDILAVSGKAVTLSRGGVHALNRQGVMLVAAGGRLAYDNTVAARLERKRPPIRKMLHTALFEAERT